MTLTVKFHVLTLIPHPPVSHPHHLYFYMEQYFTSNLKPLVYCFLFLNNSFTQIYLTQTVLSFSALGAFFRFLGGAVAGYNLYCLFSKWSALTAKVEELLEVKDSTTELQRKYYKGWNSKKENWSSTNWQIEWKSSIFWNEINHLFLHLSPKKLV